MNHGDHNVEALGYRIILRYCNATGDYEPLFDTALAKDLIPVAKFLIAHDQINTTNFSDFKELLSSAHMECFARDGIYLTKEQKAMMSFPVEQYGSLAVVAPTSYGKSEMLISRLKVADYKKACIIVPTKALLSQTLRRLIEGEVHTLGYRLLTHPDMYRTTMDRVVCVFTQERLLRLLKLDETIAFDLIMIDEAHNLLESSDRSTLLSYVLLISAHRNTDILFNFYSPFVSDASNLILKHGAYQLAAFTVRESIKSERYFLIENKDGEGARFYYDHFFDVFLDLESRPGNGDEGLVFAYAKRKNIIYLNRPRDIENVAGCMAQELPDLADVSEEVAMVVRAISDLLHEDYALLNCVRKGLVYHHGSMPDIVRLYVEHIFSSMDEFRYIIATSTLLEGVNLPADCMFILSNMKGRRSLTPAQFQNLVGRVCRFSEIFNQSSGDMALLEPPVFLVNGAYTREGANLKKFLSDSAKVTKAIKDEVDNTFIKPDEELSDQERQKLEDGLEFLENIERHTVEGATVRYSETEIGKHCFRNSVHEFDIFENEAALAAAAAEYERVDPIDDTDGLLDALTRIFILNISFTDRQERDYRAFLRLRERAARNFYSMFLSWREQGSSYRRMIASFLGYWDGITDPIVYVGSKWGEVKRNDGDMVASYVDISEKSIAERVNIAIKKIKEEQDFVDNILLKYVEVLNDLALLDEDFYQRIKYGTNNPTIITLLKNGFSIELARLISSRRYAQYVDINTENDEVNVSKQIVEAMDAAEENKLLLFEIGFHINV
ncbi:MAG: DEAD/DEAH box helicase [Deltaproteobacteria bacterium]|nr:DEAD/DEAH box helicase [Deltaproteobacteria bacterium]